MKGVLKKIVTFVTFVSLLGNLCLNASAELQNKEMKKWTFDSQDELNSFVVDLNTGAKAYENGMAKLIGSGTYTYPYDGLSLTVGKEYIVEFKGKTAALGTNGYFAVFGMYQNGDIGFCNFDAAGNLATYSNRFTAYSVNVPYVVMVGSSAYIDDIYLYEVPSMPELKSSIPANNSTGVQPSSTIKLVFNNDMKESSLLNISNYLIDNDRRVVSVTRESSTSYILQLDRTMQGNTPYTLTCSNLEDTNNLVVQDFTINFTTGQGVKPAISDIIPADGSYNVALDDIMHVEFDAEMDESTLTTEYIKVNNSTDNIDSITVNRVTHDAIDIKFKNLEYEEMYTVSFRGLRNANLETMEDKTVKFTTQPEQTMIYENDFADSSKISYPQISLGTTATHISLNNDCTSAPNSLKAEFSAANEDIYYADRENIKIIPGKYYTVSFYLKALEATQGSFYVVNGDNASYPAIISPTTNWKKYTVTYKATNNELGFFRCSAPMTIGIDDLKFCEAIETKLMEESDIPDNFETGILPSDEFKLVFNNDINTDDLANRIKIGSLPVTIISSTNNTVRFKASQTLAFDTIYALDINLKDSYDRDIVISREFKTNPTFSLGTFKIYKDYSTPERTEITDSAIVNGDITVELSDAENLTNSAEDLSILIALYKNGEMIDAKYTTVNLGADQSLENALTSTLTVPTISIDDTYELSAFLWRKYGDIRPITKKIILHN